MSNFLPLVTDNQKEFSQALINLEILFSVKYIFSQFVCLGHFRFVVNIGDEI